MDTGTSHPIQDIPQGRFLTEEAGEMRENLARVNFGMSLNEFVKALQA